VTIFHAGIILCRSFHDGMLWSYPWCSIHTGKPHFLMDVISWFVWCRSIDCQKHHNNSFSCMFLWWIWFCLYGLCQVLIMGELISPFFRSCI
jgi:hypothetical protein